MVAKTGDRIAIDSDKAGQPAREGEILEVVEHPTGPEFRVRWDDGRVTEIRPRNPRITGRRREAKVGARG
jgi:hypothetical protein